MTVVSLFMTLSPVAIINKLTSVLNSAYLHIVVNRHLIRLVLICLLMVFRRHWRFVEPNLCWTNWTGVHEHRCQSAVNIVLSWKPAQTQKRFTLAFHIIDHSIYLQWWTTVFRTNKMWPFFTPKPQPTCRLSCRLWQEATFPKHCRTQRFRIKYPTTFCQLHQFPDQGYRMCGHSCLHILEAKGCPAGHIHTIICPSLQKGPASWSSRE